ncbi:MAG: GTPase Era [Bacteroidetes bacterium]|nr:GTPase Era [Bacteroidota bacterium]
MPHKSGFVAIIGNPNAGKSTLMNALVGENLAIITQKAQTTRHRIMGIVNGDDFQIVYSDTPGIIGKAHYKMHQSMQAAVKEALEDSDIFLLVIDVAESNENLNVPEQLMQGTPLIIVLNKIDLLDQKKVEELWQSWQTTYPQAVIIPASALHRFNLDTVFQAILSALPEGEPYFPKDELTDRSIRFFISEMIREKILIYFKEEIPYSTEVVVESFKEEETITRIEATIYVERESQKAILLGHQGKAIRRLGAASRKEIENFLHKHIFLNLSIKVLKDWRNDEKLLMRFGYPNIGSDQSHQ